MSTPARRLDLIAVDAYLAMDDATRDSRLEYAAGHIFALAGASRRHAAIVRNLTTLLQRILLGRPASCPGFGFTVVDRPVGPCVPLLAA